MSMTNNNGSPPEKPWHFIILVFGLVLLILCGLSNTVFASVGEATTTASYSDHPSELLVNAAWLDDETVRIDVTDPQTGTRSNIAVPVYEQLRGGENIEFIAIQAIDPEGRQSGVIEIRNPLFNPNLPTNDTDDTLVRDAVQDVPSKSAIIAPNNNAPLTPDGTGTVVDNVTDSDGGREFFTIFSEDGNEFFLIIDRHSNTENVHFLNAVTEEDLMSLARRSGREIDSPSESVSAIPVPLPPVMDADNVADEVPSEHDTTEPRPTALQRIGNNLLMFGGIVVVVGGVAYYFKVVRPKNQDYGDYSDEPDDYAYNPDDHEEADNREEGGDDD